MTTREFSDNFDILLNSFGVTPNIIIDEYEKSVFLTNAQEELILSIYSGKNQFNDSFEKTEETRRYLDNLVITYDTNTKILNEKGINPNSQFFQIPQDVWFITYEAALFNDTTLECFNNKYAYIVPISQDDYYKINSNPFKRQNKKRVLRLNINDNKVELVSDYNIDKYLIRYLSQPTPIILTDLPNNLSINNINTKTECNLNPVIHRSILERAVRMAIISKTQLSNNKE